MLSAEINGELREDHAELYASVMFLLLIHSLSERERKWQQTCKELTVFT